MQAVISTSFHPIQAQGKGWPEEGHGWFGCWRRGSFSRL